MRLQLTLAVVALVVAGGGAVARAQTAFISKLQVYADDDHTTVVSPLVRAQADVTPETNVSAGYVADVVTSASVDIVSQASKTTIHDVRHQVSLGATHAFDRLSLHGGYTFSRENDYLSHSMSATATWLFNDKNTTLALGAALALNDVRLSGDRNFHEPLDNYSTSASLTQIFTPTLIAQLSYELSYAHGYQESPYRFVPVMNADSTNVAFWVHEQDPDDRVRHALVVGVNRHLGGGTALQLDYRFYLDTWAITSHTIDARLIMDLGPRAELRLRSRTYFQGGASFYRAEYHALETYMSVDRELSPLWSQTVGAKLALELGDDLEGELKLDGFYYSYADFPLLPSRLGMNAGLGLQMNF